LTLSWWLDLGWVADAVDGLSCRLSAIYIYVCIYIYIYMNVYVSIYIYVYIYIYIYMIHTSMLLDLGWVAGAVDGLSCRLSAVGGSGLRAQGLRLRVVGGLTRRL